MSKDKLYYKNYRKLFGSIKKRSVTTLITKMKHNYKDNIQKTWQIMKELIGKGKFFNN